MVDPTGARERTMEYLAEEFPALSDSAKAFVRDHPRDARLTVAVALETAAAGFGATFA